MNIRHILASNLLWFRKMRGFSQGEVASRAKINRTYVSAIERSKFAATIDVVNRIAQALDVSTHDMLLNPELRERPVDHKRTWPEYVSDKSWSVVYVALSTLPVSECAALLLSYLSYPGLDSAAYWNRVNLERAICNNFARKKAESNPDWGLSSQLLRPSYLLISEPDVEKVLSGFYRQAKKRFVVAQAVGELIGINSSFKSVNKSRLGGHSIHLGRMAEKISPHVGENDITNVLSRVMSPGFSVVHIALALNCLQSSGYISSDSLDEKVRILCLRKDALQFVLRTAENIRMSIIASVRMRRDLRTMIEFRET